MIHIYERPKKGDKIRLTAEDKIIKQLKRLNKNIKHFGRKNRPFQPS